MTIEWLRVFELFVYQFNKCEFLRDPNADLTFEQHSLEQK